MKTPVGIPIHQKIALSIGDSRGGLISGASDWEYADLATAESSGDSWQDGDIITITGGANFVYLSALAVSGYSGLIHQSPYDGTGTLGEMSSASNVTSTAQGSDPDTWGWTDVSPGTKGVDYEFDTASSRSRVTAIGNNDTGKISGGSFGASDAESFLILDDLKMALSGTDSADSNRAGYSLLAYVDGVNDAGITLRQRWNISGATNNWTLFSGSTEVNTGKAYGTEARVWMYVKDGRWALWFDDEATPTLSGTVPYTGSTSSYRASVASLTGANTSNCHQTLTQVVTGRMTTA